MSPVILFKTSNHSKTKEQSVEVMFLAKMKIRLGLVLEIDVVR
jgi:hypothetical protein